MTPDSLPEEITVLRCESCDAPYDSGDNFCRHCGASLNDESPAIERVSLPAVPNRHYEPVPWRPAVPAAVGGVAVLAAGTLAEMVLRGLASRLFRTGTRLVARRPEKDERGTAVMKAEPIDTGTDSGAQVVSETWFFRRVRVRRQGDRV